jgi:hypothetical protein
LKYYEDYIPRWNKEEEVMVEEQGSEKEVGRRMWVEKQGQGEKRSERMNRARPNKPFSEK